MLSILTVGLLIGMLHALEADHVAAVATMAARETSTRRIVTHGAVWGLGHTLTLMALAGGAVLFGLTVGDRMAARLEFAVGVMLVMMGGHLLYRLWRDRVHFHIHRHGDDVVHFHAHSHRGESLAHDPAHHPHSHAEGLPLRALLVGMMHGLAGSSGLLVLTAATVDSAALGIAYVALFGVGSIIGMAALSAVVAIPLRWSARALTWGNRALQAGVGAVTVALGLSVALEAAAGAF